MPTKHPVSNHNRGRGKIKWMFSVLWSSPTDHIRVTIFICWLHCIVNTSLNKLHLNVFCCNANMKQQRVFWVKPLPQLVSIAGQTLLIIISWFQLCTCFFVCMLQFLEREHNNSGFLHKSLKEWTLTVNPIQQTMTMLNLGQR